MVRSIFLIEDDEEIRTLLKKLLLDEGFNVRAFSEGITALEEIVKQQPDLVILDLMLPKLKGESIVAEIKKQFPEIPVIILTAKGSSPEVVAGFRLGADDYIAKPFDIDVLLARINARLNVFTKGESKLVVSDLVLDTNKIEASRAGRKITLTPQEFKLLEYMMQNKGRILTRDMILNRIWLFSTDVDTRVVDVYIGYLRRKIDSGFKKKLISSKRGFGYMIQE